MNSSRDALFPGGTRWWSGGAADTPWALPVLLVGVCLASLSANLLALAVLARQLRRGKLRPSDALLLNLCAADVLLAVYCAPPRLAAYSGRPWLLGGFVCKTADWLLHGCLVAKSFTWAAVAREHRRQALPTGKEGAPGWRPAGIAASLWLAALGLPLPQLIFARLEDAPGGGPPAPPLRRCVSLAPAYAANFMDVFAKVYPLLACLAPAAFACSWCWRALRAQKGYPERQQQQQHRWRRRQEQLRGPLDSCPEAGRKVTRALLALVLLFQVMWLPEWAVWLWEWHRDSLARRGDGPPPPPPPPVLLAVVAELLLFLNGALCPAVLGATWPELHAGLIGVWTELRCRTGGARGPSGAPVSGSVTGPPVEDSSPQPLRELREGEAAEKIPPDVEHFWSDRRNTTAREEDDPVPWERDEAP